MIYYWFLVACSLGTFGFLRPHRYRSTSCSTVPTKSFKSKSLPAPNYRRLRLIFFSYVLLLSAHVHAITQERLPLHSLCFIPLFFSGGSYIIYFRQFWQLHAINHLLTTNPYSPSFQYNHPCCGLEPPFTLDHPCCGSFFPTSSN